jgi:outer membrane protein assembly factor BamB
VTSYDNNNGRPLWSRPTGKVPQAWRLDQGQLYITVATGGYLGSAPVTALRRISLKTGAERTIRPSLGPFAGTLSGAFDGAVLFSGSHGLAAYSGATGQLLWQLNDALPEDIDAERGILYVVSHSAVTGVDPQTGIRIPRTTVPGSSDLYAIRGGVALGLDLGMPGEAWGYDIATRRVIWTTSPLPWPHYFVDLSGIGGSADPRSSTVLLSSCAALGPAPAGGTGSAGPPCLGPELIAVDR